MSTDQTITAGASKGKGRVQKRGQAVAERASLREALFMLLPFAGMLVSGVEFAAVPNVHPIGYLPHHWIPTLCLCATVYLAFFLLACFVAPVRKKAHHFSPLICAFFLFFTVQDLLTLKSGILEMPFIPSPDKIVRSLCENWQMALADTASSLGTLMLGFALGVAFGLFSGITAGCSKLFNYWVNPLLKIVGPVPALIWMPICFVVFHSSRAAAITCVVVAAWFPLTLMLSSAIANTPRELIEHAQTLGASKLYIVFHVMLPNAIPALANALFMALSHSFGAMAATELCGVNSGLMMRISFVQAQAQFGIVWGYIGIMITVFSVLTTLMFAFRNWLLRWQKGYVRW